MNDIYKMSMLIDFYGQLLTQRQLEIMDLHYNNDYSLGEIAEQLDISRQGVYDNIKRGKAVLFDMEKKLGLVRKFSEKKQKAEEILHNVNDMDVTKMSEADKNRICVIKEAIQEIINKF